MPGAKTYRNKKNEITSTIEEYLETILHLEEKGEKARVKDISTAMGVTYASTSEILRKLARLELIEHEPYGCVSLSESGRRIAKKILDREAAVFYFLRNALGLDEKSAKEEACRLEHVLGDAAGERLAAWVEFVKISPGFEHINKAFAEKFSAERKRPNDD